MARVLGLDPGFASFGYAVVDIALDGETVHTLGVLRTQASAAKRGVRATDDSWRRARELSGALLPLVDGVQVVCVEAPSLPRNASTTFKMGLAYGALVSIVEAARTPTVMVTPQELKKAVSGRSSASKGDVAAALDRRFGRDFAAELIKRGVPRTFHEHAYDAVGAVVACLGSEVLHMARRM